MAEDLELLVEREENDTLLLSPAVGEWTCAVPRGRVLVPGEEAGRLLVLGRAHVLRVPAGVRGVVRSELPEPVRQPVGFRERLYVLGSLAGEALEASAPDAGAAREEGLVVRASQSGRFYRRPAPDAEPFVEEGSIVTDGEPLGLIEVMKTFATIPYRAEGGLPARARVVRVLAEDRAEIGEGEPLLVVEPA